MYARRSGHSAKNRSLDEPAELNFAGVVGFFGGSVVVVSWGSVVVGGLVPAGAASGLSPMHPATVNVAIATTRDAIGSVRVMRI
jgi:hypothetical protein